MKNSVTLKPMTPENFYKYLCKNFQYGIVVDGKPAEFNGDNEDLYRTLSTQEFEKYKTGTCWDFAEYQCLYFQKYFPKLNPKLWYIEVKDKDGDLPSHSWMSFNMPGKGITVMEVSWGKKRGLHTFADEIEMLRQYTQWHMEEYNCVGSDFILLRYEPISLKIHGLDWMQYMRLVFKYGEKVGGKGSATTRWYY